MLHCSELMPSMDQADLGAGFGSPARMFSAMSAGPEVEVSFRDWTIVAMLGIGWGASFLFNAILLEEVGPLSVSFLRIALGAATCWIYVLATGRMEPVTLRLLGQVLVLGVISYAVPLALYPMAQQHIASGVAGIINAMMPIMVVIVSQVWPGGERATRAKSLGVGFGFAGIVALMAPAVQSGETVRIWAILIALMAPVCYAVALNYLRRLRSHDPATIAALALTAGALAIAPVMLAVEGCPTLSRPESWGALAVLGPVLTGISFIALYRLVPRIGATNASTVTFVAPISAVYLGHVVLGDSIETVQLFGMVMIFCGLLAIDGRLLRKLRRWA
jgi:drug/metabolite transporter (DMT)-like permease